MANLEKNFEKLLLQNMHFIEKLIIKLMLKNLSQSLLLPKSQNQPSHFQIIDSSLNMLFRRLF
jgi:hypothetical protein